MSVENLSPMASLDKIVLLIPWSYCHIDCRNARYMQDFTENELAEITKILEEAPEVGFQGETSEETLAKMH